MQVSVFIIASGVYRVCLGRLVYKPNLRKRHHPSTHKITCFNFCSATGKSYYVPILLNFVRGYSWLWSSLTCDRVWLFICCKTKLKKKIFFFEKNICFLQNIHYLQKKNFYTEKKFYNEKFFYWKKTFFTMKNVNENVKNIYLILEIHYHTKNVFVSSKI